MVCLPNFCWGKKYNYLIQTFKKLFFMLKVELLDTICLLFHCTKFSIYVHQRPQVSTNHESYHDLVRIVAVETKVSPAVWQDIGLACCVIINRSTFYSESELTSLFVDDFVHQNSARTGPEVLQLSLKPWNLFFFIVSWSHPALDDITSKLLSNFALVI